MSPEPENAAALARGAVYVATRNPRYVVLAAASARSLRTHAPRLPITLFTNVLEIPPEFATAFDAITTIPSPQRVAVEWANGLVDKIHGIQASPYERTFFIDADTLVRSADVMKAFDLLDDYDVLLTECAPDASLSRRLMARPLYSTGILVYRRSAAVIRLLDAWMAYTLECIAAVRDERLDFFTGLDGLERDRKIFLALTDQYTLAHLLSPGRNTHGVWVKVLEERWNFRGDGRRAAPSGMVVDHQMDIKQGSGTPAA